MGRLPLGLLCLLVAAMVTGPAAGAPPMHASQGRRSLLQAATVAAPAPAPGPAGDISTVPAPAPYSLPGGGSSLGTIIETLVDQKCTMINRALLAGRELVAAAANLQPDAVSCCQSCLSRGDCTAWVYCPLPGGCTAAADSNATRSAAAHARLEPAAVAAQLVAPHQGCRLLSPPPFRLRKDSAEILVKGADVPFISGVPVSITLPVLANYSVRPGTDTAGGLGYSCPESLVLSSCLVQGQVEELGAICDSDPQCKAFVYLPNGVDSMSDPIGILKGGSHVTSLPVSALKPNPATALYIKASVPTTVEGWSEGRFGDGCSCGGADDSGGQAVAADGQPTHCGGGSSVLWIVLPTLLAAALVAVAAVAAYATVALRQQARRREAAAAAAAAQQQRREGRDKAPSAAIQLVPGAPVALPACVSLHLLKPTPPCSGSSAHSGGSGRSATGRSTSGTSMGVPCPQCGATLGLAAAAAVVRPPSSGTPPTPRQQRQQQQGPPPASADSLAASRPGSGDGQQPRAASPGQPPV